MPVSLTRPAATNYACTYPRVTAEAEENKRLQRDSKKNLYSHGLAIELGWPEDPFVYRQHNRVADARVRSLLHGNATDFAFFVHHGVNHDLPLGVLLFQVSGNLWPLAHDCRGRRYLRISP